MVRGPGAGAAARPVFRFLTGVLGYDMRVSASDMLLIDRYPPFALTPPADYPVQIECGPPRSTGSRCSSASS